MSVSKDELFKSITRYATQNRCACSACRALRDWYVKALEIRIEELSNERASII